VPCPKAIAMTDFRPDTHHISKTQLINDATVGSAHKAVGVIISPAIRDEIRATNGWLLLQALVDPKFQPGQFEIVTNEFIWQTRLDDLKTADLEPYSRRERARVRAAVILFIVGVIGLISILGYFVFLL
jgi:hypothetical protein